MLLFGANYNVYHDNCSEISSEFNNFFVSAASKIKEPIGPFNFDRLRTFCNEKKYLKIQVFFNSYLRAWKSWKTSKNIDITKATGADNIGPRLLKLAAPYISECLTFICNQSIINSIFPEKWKEGKLAPVYKNVQKMIQIIIYLSQYYQYYQSY